MQWLVIFFCFLKEHAMVSLSERKCDDFFLGLGMNRSPLYDSTRNKKLIYLLIEYYLYTSCHIKSSLILIALTERCIIITNNYHHHCPIMSTGTATGTATKMTVNLNFMVHPGTHHHRLFATKMAMGTVTKTLTIGTVQCLVIIIVNMVHPY